MGKPSCTGTCNLLFARQAGHVSGAGQMWYVLPPSNKETYFVMIPSEMFGTTARTTAPTAPSIVTPTAALTVAPTVATTVATMAITGRSAVPTAAPNAAPNAAANTTP